MACSTHEKAVRMRGLAAQFRGYAAHTGLSVYQAKMLHAALDLEHEADELDDYGWLPPTPSDPHALRAG